MINIHINSGKGIRVARTKDTDVFGIFMGYKFTDWVPILENLNFKTWVFTRTNPGIIF